MRVTFDLMKTHDARSFGETRHLTRMGLTVCGLVTLDVLVEVRLQGGPAGIIKLRHDGHRQTRSWLLGGDGASIIPDLKLESCF